jgi:Spy/CpxP family protein refolding chaperone
VAALVVVVLMAQVAEAQRGEGGRRGRGGRGMIGRNISMVQLVSRSDAVQAALKTTDEQKAAIEELSDQLRADSREVIDRGGGGFRAAQEEIAKLNEKASAKLAEVLVAEQQKRLMGISIQVNGAAALAEPAIAKELKITKEQEAKLDEVRESNMEAARETFADFRDLSREEVQAKFQEVRAESDKNLLAVLTSEQQAQFEALKGDPVEVDMSDFRGRFGGGFRGGRDGGGRDGEGRRRGGRNRGDADAADGDAQ